jgi:hypothetical protein
MRNKLKLTEQLVAQLPDQYRVSVETARTTWWFNIRPSGGMRLTALGVKVLKERLDIKHYEYKIQDPFLINQKTILKLDRLLQEPYYIVTAKGRAASILFFGSREAMLVNLYGDLQKFLDNYHN